MTHSIFQNCKNLDTDYLDATYGNDAETAAIVFEQYLADLSGNLELLKNALNTEDVQSFQHHIHKQKAGYSYVGLTDVTQKIQELQLKCATREDLATCRQEINAMINRIETSRSVISETLAQIQS